MSLVKQFISKNQCRIISSSHVRMFPPRYLSSSSSESKSTPHNTFTPEELGEIHSMLRVNQSGEIGANYIYKGQLFVLGRDPKTRKLLQHMWDQEKTHLEVFDSIISQNRVRPSALRPVWETAGFLVGMGTALLGKEAAMACTEAVETAIGQHYNDQLRDLQKYGDNPDIKKLQHIIKDFRDDELEHLDTAVEHDAKNAPAYPVLNALIQTGCQAAIWIAKRV